MLKGRSRDPRSVGVTSPPPPHSHGVLRSAAPMHSTMRTTTPSMQRSALRPEPDYEVVEFPNEQYVNAKLQPPPPPPPRPPTGHPLDADASCGLCGGGGARVRCTECGRRALCASCDDMYHRHPKRRNHQRQALSQSQIRDERPPLPPKVAPPVPPPRRHKIGGDRMSASPKPPMQDQRRGTLNHMPMMMGSHTPSSTHTNHLTTQHQQIPLQTKITSTPTLNHIGSMPFLPTNMHHPTAQAPIHTNTLSHMSSAWNRTQRTPQGLPQHPNMTTQPEPWDNSEHVGPTMQNWGRPLRRGASVLELSGNAAGSCAGCAQCAPMAWRYGSCASLEHTWGAPTPAWGVPAPCCTPPHLAHTAHMHPHPHVHPPQTPQPYRRGETRTVSRAASRAGSRAASPAISIRSRTSRRHKHRTPSPPPLPSSDADSESERESDHEPAAIPQDKNEDSLGPAPPPPTSTWQCEHCTYVNEPGVRVCVICCRTQTTTAKPIPNTEEFSKNIERLKITSKQSDSPSRFKEETNVEREKSNTKTKRERTSTGCGPSPPRENTVKKSTNRLVTPTRESNGHNRPATSSQPKHDMAVGPSPPRELQNSAQLNRSDTNTSPARESRTISKAYPYKEIPNSSKFETSNRHSVSVGPSPPRESPVSRPINNEQINVQKKSTGTSPPCNNMDGRPAAASSRSNVSNTGTSPPPQSISTQTYEVPNSWERAPSASRSRPRRRFRDDNRRERSHSRHSLSSDTRESERSVRTTGPENRWEWRERDSSPGGDWGDGYNRLLRRASHLDLRRTRTNRRSSFYGSEAPSPERQSTNRTISLEALASAGTRREAERGMELARLMGEAEKLGFSAAEVQAALTQSPTAPLAWLRERWPSLCAGVRAAAARLAPTAVFSELEARAALARHRGAMWPAVTECVERHRSQVEMTGVGEEGRLRGHVWGSPVGVDDDAAPPRSSSRHSHRMREDSSDEFEAPTRPIFQEDDWMYLPLNINIDDYRTEENNNGNKLQKINTEKIKKDDISKKLRALLEDAGIPLINENLLLKGLLSGNSVFETGEFGHPNQQPIDLVTSENDFIDAYNALTRLSPLPNINVNVNDNNDTIKPMTHKKTSNKSLVINNNNVTSSSNKYIDNEEEPRHKNNIQQQVSHVKQNANDTRHASVSSDNHIPAKNVPFLEKTLVKSNNSNPVSVVQPVINTETMPLSIENESTSPKSSTNHETQRQSDEKVNNLSDMVDNTQRLIQQMKEEINSDINSIDGRNGSQSENENSSEESDEQESSYSGTEEKTDNLTSDEKEITSSEEESFANEDVTRYSEKEQVEKQQVMQYRTSSEDNDNFEEALDHVENHLEDFKQTNIEILDSITRTLQEEHTFTVERSEPNSKSIAMPSKKQDQNNNLFVAVNNFDEIYEELNNIRPVIHPEVPQELKTVTEPKLVNLLVKDTMIYYTVKNSIPRKLVISESKIPILNAKLEIVENEQSDIAEISTQSNAESTVLSVDPDVHITQRVNETTNDISTQNNENNPKTDSDPMLDHQQELRDITNFQNAEGSMLTVLPENNIERQDIELENSIENVSHKICNALIIQNIATKHENDNNITMGLSNASSHNKQSNEKNVNNKSTDNIKSPILNKSNIPKLIKIMPNNKNKLDSHSPKLTISKVPIRRTSIKHYPAPAPPKSHFGNIQSGHVKQLQTRLFNNKTSPPKSVPVTSEIVEIKATTSTLSKKKQAPPPPVIKQEEKPTSLAKAVIPEKEKKQYFRETCRTEDEWTDSDSGDSQLQIIRPNEEEPQYSPPSPPPPLTLRRVSGQLIDLAKIRLSEGSPERQARMLLAEGATENWEQAQLAVELVSRGADAPAAILAALECTDLDSALAYLFQDCELCASRLPEHEMVSMLRCTHRCCRECAHHYFTVQITERSIVDCVCPYCKLPELENLPEDAWLEYFAHLDILLKTLLATDVHELFQRKLRDRTLARDPNFRWCMECSSGFFVHPRQKKIRCPECRSVSCAACRKQWTANHEGLTCEQYTAWLEDNDPERSVTAIQQHLRDNGLECPRCHFKYSLSRGGCMHFTCTQCKYEFCYGCGKPFTMGARCGLSDYCAKLGLHAHHPRNCLFYLRDKEPHELQTLLQMNNVTYEIEPADGSTGRCPVQLQRETPTGLVDGTCGNEAPAKHAGLCKGHYVEYLAGLARGLDPIPIMDVPELVAELRRRALPLPERGPWDTDPIYAGMCAEIVKEKIPLD